MFLGSGEDEHLVSEVEGEAYDEISISNQTSADIYEPQREPSEDINPQNLGAEVLEEEINHPVAKATPDLDGETVVKFILLGAVDKIIVGNVSDLPDSEHIVTSNSKKRVTWWDDNSSHVPTPTNNPLTGVDFANQPGFDEDASSEHDPKPTGQNFVEEVTKNSTIIEPPINRGQEGQETLEGPENAIGQKDGVGLTNRTVLKNTVATTSQASPQMKIIMPSRTNLRPSEKVGKRAAKRSLARKLDVELKVKQMEENGKYVRWVKFVPGSQDSILCRYCGNDFTASITELEKHATGKTHTRRVQEAAEI